MVPAERRRTAALLVALLLAGAAQAAPPREEPIHIEADRAELDERRGTAVYRGDVRLRQGTMRAAGTELTLHTGPDRRLERAVITGAPAVWRREPGAEGPALEGEARRIEYFPAERRVVLTGAAVLRRGASRFRSERIVYDLARDVVLAGPGADGRGRVRATIVPGGEAAR